jgi:hypothetical protein
MLQVREKKAQTDRGDRDRERENPTIRARMSTNQLGIIDRRASMCKGLGPGARAGGRGAAKVKKRVAIVLELTTNGELSPPGSNQIADRAHLTTGSGL